MRLPIALLLLLSASTLPAETGFQQPPIKDFSLPFFNPDGSRSAYLRGDEARFLDSTHYFITNLNFSLFSKEHKNSAESVLLAPGANVAILGKQPVVEGTEQVRLIRDDLEASGEEWRYEHEGRRLTMHRNVRVVFSSQLQVLLK